MQHLKAFFCLMLLLAAGCKPSEPRPEPEPPAQEETKPQAQPTVCERAYENVLRVARASGSRIQTLDRMGKDRAGFLKRCEKTAPAVATCLAQGKDASTLAKCPELQPGAPILKPDQAALCERAYDNAIAVLEAEQAPPPAIERMRDRRGDALVACLREKPEVVRCLAEAGGTEAIRACRSAARPIDPVREARCTAAFERLLTVVKPGVDMPKEAADSLGRQRQEFVTGCMTSEPGVADCMAGAADFAAFQACAKAR